MIADTLLNWDKTELANILADKMADADDLVEAIPAIEKASNIEEGILEDFIQSNWKLILSNFDVDELLEWIEEKDYEAEWEQWENECVERDHEYAEAKDNEYYYSFLELMFSFRVMDLAEQWGHPPKWRKS